MGSSKNSSTSKSTSNTTQKQSNIGAPYAQALLPQAQALSNEVMGQQAFTGDRVATAPVQDQYVAQWGTPTQPFVPQQTAGQTANQTNRNWVDVNAQEGIDAGMAAANANAARIPGITNNLYDYWGNIAAGGGQNPYLDEVINRFSTDFTEQQARERNQRAYQAGAQGAFGGSGFNQGEAWAAEQAAQAYGSQVAGLRYQDFLNTQNLISQSPEQLAQIASLNMLPAEQFARYGGMRQENLRGAQGVADDNAQRDAYNQWLAATLNDTNATRASANDQARLEYDYRASDAAIRNNLARVGAQQTNDQAGLDNAYLKWLTQQETLNNKISGLGGITGLYTGLGSTDQSMTGTQNTTTKTESKQTAAPWQVAAGLGGAALSAFAGPAGGAFSGSLSALGKTAAQSALAPTAFSSLPQLNTQMPWLQPTQLPRVGG